MDDNDCTLRSPLRLRSALAPLRVVSHVWRALLAAAAIALVPSTAAHCAEWKTVKAFGVELQAPSNWRRIELRTPRDDHDEVQFAETFPDVTKGAWFSVFPNAVDLEDPDLVAQPTAIDGQPAKRTEQTLGENDPPPRRIRRQVVIYFDDKTRPAFLFDGDDSKWPALNATLTKILASIKLPPR